MAVGQAKTPGRSALAGAALLCALSGASAEPVLGVPSLAHPLAAVPCTPATGQTEWLSNPPLARDGATGSLTGAAASDGLITSSMTEADIGTEGAAVQMPVAVSLRPYAPLGDGAAAATLAGAVLLLLGGWRWYQSARLPWPAQDDRALPQPTGDNHSSARAAPVQGWHLSRFDDLPEAEPERPLRPLYDSLDDVVDVVPLPARY